MADGEPRSHHTHLCGESGLSFDRATKASSKRDMKEENSLFYSFISLFEFLKLSENETF